MAEQFYRNRKNGKVIGVTDPPDEVSTQVSNMIRDGIKPDATTLTEYNVESINGKMLLELMSKKAQEIHTTL